MMNKHHLQSTDRRSFFWKRTDEAIRGRHSSIVSLTIMRAGITMAWRTRKHQSEGIGTEARLTGTILLQRTSLTSNLGISSCCPRLAMSSTIPASSGLVGGGLRNRLICDSVFQRELKPC